MQTFIDTIIQKLSEFFNPEVLGNQVSNLIIAIVVALVIFIGYYILARVLVFVTHIIMERTKVDRTMESFIETVLYYAILTFGVVNALAVAGINTTALAASLGLAGLTIGFAARDALSNLISGILIHFDRPFVIGDLVEIEEFYGTVDQITLRSTRIITQDGKMLAVPNTEIINKTVASYTNFPNLRLNVGVSIAVTEDLDNVRTIILGLVEGDPDYLDDPAPRVVVKQLNDYNVLLELHVWLVDERKHIRNRYELREKIFNSLTEANVHMPYETFQLASFETKLINA